MKLYAKVQICIISASLGLLIIFSGRGLAQQYQSYQAQRNSVSIELIQDRAERLEVRLAAVEKIALDRGDRLARIETNLELQGRVIWGLIITALGIGVERIMAIRKAQD